MYKIRVALCVWVMGWGLLAGGMLYAQHPDDGTLRRLRVPILMYHYVDELPEDADEIRINLTVSPSDFRAQMVYLRDNGYTPISLYTLEQALAFGEPLPAKPLVLTFDDGHIDHYTQVFPILREFGFTGTFFIITGLIDNNRAEYLSWAQVQEMADAGMSMEPHTKYHADLRNREQDYLVYEILGSLESIQAYTGKTPRFFAYPGGNYDDTTLAVLRGSPIQRAVTTQTGAWHTSTNRLELPRLRVSNNTGVSGLAYLLSADWN